MEERTTRPRSQDPSRASASSHSPPKNQRHAFSRSSPRPLVASRRSTSSDLYPPQTLTRLSRVGQDTRSTRRYC
ncbi:hypothetical protein CGRA01v4_10307 [Colletotrichum graminicola]|nr:hypothetical protein CGRA01v4_10307 [Colletotrichum graminicola]